MKLLRLYIINSGVFKSNLIEFTDENNQPKDMVCLSGVNGSGKTTIFELIQNLLSFMEDTTLGIDRSKPNVLAKTEFAQLDILYNGIVISLISGNSKYKQVQPNIEQVFIIEEEFANIFSEIENLIKVRNYSDITENDLIDDSMKYDLERLVKRLANRRRKKVNSKKHRNLFKTIEDKINKHITEDEKDELPHAIYLPNQLRTIFDVRPSSLPKKEYSYHLIDVYQPAKHDLNTQLVYLEYAYPEKFIKLKEWVNNEILEDKKIDSVDRTKFKVLIKTNSGNIHGLESLSSGEESLLIISIFIYLNASKNSVVLIDEIDQSLHPEYQMKIMYIIKKLKEKFKCQFIISSHSEITWNEFKEKDIIRLTEVVR